MESRQQAAAVWMNCCLECTIYGSSTIQAMHGPAKETRKRLNIQALDPSVDVIGAQTEHRAEGFL